MVVAHANIDDLYADADADRLFEIIRGRVVYQQASLVQSFIASRLGLMLFTFCDERDVGRAFVHASFHLPVSGNDRKPDVAFVSYEKWAKVRPIPQVNAWEVVPDLAVEVISPTDKAFDVMDKVREYFESGVRQVWQVYSNLRMVFIFESPTAVRILTEAEELNGDPIVPGFRMPVAKLFPPTEPLAN